jgi:hypothetical protein
MMAAKVVFTILQENHEGPIGDDWRYWVEAKVFNQGLKGEGKIVVKKHSLPTGTTQVPPGPPEPLELPAGECGQKVKVKLTLEATEVDLFRNDVGITDIDTYLDCPGPGQEPLVRDGQISVGVIESPGITGETSIVTLQIRLVLSCD